MVENDQDEPIITKIEPSAKITDWMKQLRVARILTEDHER